ncbi:MAG: hypothetical protein JRG83_11730 [Deltaproteobacteria bacterium]|nr:hypothetical protein [Deltaproteobacteria bacterium]
MAKMVEIDFNPDVRTLRQFGWIALGGFGLLAGLAWFEKLIFSFGLGDARTTVAGAFLAVGVLAAVIGVAYPKANRFLFVGLTILAFPIGFVLSYVIMMTLFFLIIGPIGVVMRLAGHDPLNRKLEPDAASYWTPAEPMPPRERYFKQF